MDASPWRIAIISTGYDLSDLRSVIAESIHELGFDGLAYELPGYPVEPNVHSHNACLHAIKQADIVILIIDQRYGGFYVGSTGMSITEEEYNEAVKENKIIIPCIRKKSWDERHTLFKTAESLGLSRDEAKTTLTTSYVQNWEVLEFIEKVRKADTDNFVITFEDPTDLRININSRLEGISRFILELITKEQKKIVQAIKTSTGMDLSLGDVLSKGYFLDPPFKIITGTKNSEDSVADFINKIRRQKLGIALYGGPGSGKTTLVAKAFLEHADYCIDNKEIDIPFFISLRGKGSDYKFSIDDFIDVSFKELINKEVYPVLRMTSIRPVFYIDGFDEISEDVQNINLQEVANSQILSQAFIFSCRLRFAKDYLNEITFGNKLNYIIELSSWKLDLALEYIDKFCRIHDKDELSIDLKEYFQDNTELEAIASNPLLLTLFLWVVEMSEMSLPLDIRNKTNLFDKCIDLWIKRDIARLEIDGTQEGRIAEDRIKRAWKIASWEIYKSRFPDEQSPILSQLVESIINVDQELEKISNNEAFLGIFEINTSTKKVRGMMHEQFLEHLAAYSIVEGMKNNKYPFPDSLDFVIRPEINRIIRAIWKEKGTSYQNDILQNLWNIYLRNFDFVDPQNIFRRNQAAYYIGRINSNLSLEKLQQAKNLEKNISVHLSISFGLIKKGDFREEEILYNKLKRDMEVDIANRGYHMVYYRDLQTGGPPYIDPGTSTWNNTLNALLRHLESHSMRHLILRRVELFTIKRFIETRIEKGPVTQEIMQRIENSINNTPDLSSDLWETYFTKVQHELEELKRSWASI